MLRENNTQRQLQLYSVMRLAHAHENMQGMARPMRPTDEINRENLRLLEEACARIVGKARGGQIYLSRLVGTPASHLSAIRNAARTGRRMGPDFKDKVEKRLNLGRGWMDSEHDGAAVGELVRKLSLLPRPQSGGTRAFRPGYGRLVDTVTELQRQIDELKSQLGSKPSTRK